MLCSSHSSRDDAGEKLEECFRQALEDQDEVLPAIYGALASLLPMEVSTQVRGADVDAIFCTYWWGNSRSSKVARTWCCRTNSRSVALRTRAQRISNHGYDCQR